MQQNDRTLAAGAGGGGGWGKLRALLSNPAQQAVLALNAGAAGGSKEMIATTLSAQPLLINPV